MANKLTIHPSVTEDRVTEATERQMFGTDNPGICLSCGEDAEGCEPDARRYECECCGENFVYGAQEILISGYYHSRRVA